MKITSIILVAFMLIGCGYQAKQQVVKETPKAAPVVKKIETKDVAVDFIKCKAPKDCKIDQSYNSISFNDIDLEISQDSLFPDLSSVGEEASDSIDIFSSGKNKKITTYNGIKYLDCYDSSSRYLFYVTGDKLVRIYLYGDKISQEQLIVLNSLSYNLKGNVFNVDYFVNKTNAGAGFEFDPNTGNKVPEGTLKKSSKDTGTTDYSIDTDSSDTDESSEDTSDMIWVEGYTTKSGKYVNGYWRHK